MTSRKPPSRKQNNKPESEHSDKQISLGLGIGLIIGGFVLSVAVNMILGLVFIGCGIMFLVSGDKILSEPYDPNDKHSHYDEDPYDPLLDDDDSGFYIWGDDDSDD